MGNPVSEFLEFDQQLEKRAAGPAGLGYAKSVLLRGALPGAAIGGGLGAAMAEEDSRLQGALAGGAGGALLGAGGAAAADAPVYKMRKHWTDIANKARGLGNKATLESVDAVDDLKRAVGTPYSGQEPLKKEVAEQVSKRVSDADDMAGRAAQAAEEGEFAERLLKGEKFEHPTGGTMGVPQFGEGDPMGYLGTPLGLGASGGLVGSVAATPFAADPDAPPKKKSAAQIVKEAAGIINPELAKETFGKALMGGLGAAGAGVALSAGVGLGQKAIQAATSAINRGRGYKRMMEIHPDLAERDDQQVKGMYNLLHKASPTMAMNPYVAGGFIRRTEHASNYVDPKMVSDLAGAEANIQRNAWGGMSEPLRVASGMMPGLNLGEVGGSDDGK